MSHVARRLRFLQVAMLFIYLLVIGIKWHCLWVLFGHLLGAATAKSADTLVSTFNPIDKTWCVRYVQLSLL